MQHLHIQPFLQLTSLPNIFQQDQFLERFTPLDIHICPKLASFALLIHHIFQPQGLVLGHQEA
jgi:hypothetical protein